MGCIFVNCMGRKLSFSFDFKHIARVGKVFVPGDVIKFAVRAKGCLRGGGCHIIIIIERIGKGY